MDNTSRLHAAEANAKAANEAAKAALARAVDAERRVGVVEAHNRSLANQLSASQGREGALQQRLMDLEQRISRLEDQHADNR